jgi:DNA-binding ferritin-like protein
MEIDNMYIKDIEMALNYAIKSIEKELEICEETSDKTQEEILNKRLEKFKFLIKKLSKMQP